MNSPTLDRIYVDPKDGKEYPYSSSWVKQNCMDCGALFPDPVENYELRGNYCGKCNAKYMTLKFPNHDTD